LLPISTTTTDPERTYPWGKTHPKRARFNHPKSGRSWPFPKRVDCTIATNDEQPEYRFVLMMFSRPFHLHPLHLCSLVRRFSGLVRKIATRAARLVTVLTENPPARHTEFSLGTGTDNSLVFMFFSFISRSRSSGKWKALTNQPRKSV